jgi:predicted outer membrane repeat protein
MKKTLFSICFSLITLVSLSQTIIVQNTNNSGTGSLRDAVFNALSGDTIRFNPNLISSGSNTILLSSKITFSKRLTIIGLYNSTDTLFISGGNSTGVFKIDNTSKVYFDSIVIINGKSDWGAAIRYSNSDSLIVRNSVFRNNSVTQSGGAIHGPNYLSLVNSVVKDNDCTFSGGGIHASSVEINNSLISNNIADNTYGGGIYAHTSARVNSSILRNNSSQDRGGGIHVNNGACFLIDSKIENNSVIDNGGGIYAFWVYLDNSIVQNNTANYGGGIDFTILLKLQNNSQITNNIAVIDGGGVFSELSTDSLLITNSIVSDNNAGGKGGGIYIYESSGSLSTTWIKINNSSIRNNVAAWGGGIHTEAYFSARFLIYCDNSTFSNNVSSSNAGGGIYSFSSASPSFVDITNSTFNNNYGYSGGAIYSRGSSSNVSIKTSTFSNNTAETSGGAILSAASGTFNATTIDYSTFYQNSASSSANSIFAGDLTVKSSILFSSGATSNLDFTTFNSLGYNLFSDASIVNSHITDYINVSESNLNLGPLVNNGGNTATHQPSFTSLAFDSGDPLNVSYAQNGPIDGVRDRGAAEGNCRSYNVNNIVACDNYMWDYTGQTYFTDTIIRDTLFNANVNACDSIVILDLKVNSSIINSQTITACSEYDWNGTIYTTSGSYIANLSTISGCDSIVTLNLTIEDLAFPVANLATLPAIASQCQVEFITAPSATDNCSGVITATSDVAFPITDSGTTVITWTYDDGNGNTSTQTQLVIIEDVTAPTPNVLNLPNLTSECEITALAPTATDNCAGEITATTDALFPITAIGTTTVTWTFDDGNGNTSTQTQTIIITPIDNGISQLDAISFSADASGYNYQWVDCDNGNSPISGATNQVFTPTLAGNYACEVNNGTCTVTTACLSSTIGILENTFGSSLVVSPNPTTGNIRVDLGDLKTAISIKLINALGQVVMTKSFGAADEIQLNVEESSGLYILEVQSEDGKIARMVVIKE